MDTKPADRPFLTPETQDFIDELAVQNAPPIYTLTPEAARKVLLDAQSKLKNKPSADVEDHVVPVRKSDKIDVRFIRPRGNKEQLPVIFYIHGGGWILGDENTHDRLIRELSVGTGACVAFPIYTPSPEIQFPVTLEQIYDALVHIQVYADRFNVNSSRIILAGDSVGGNMATAVAIMAKERRGPEILFQLLFYPVTDASFETASYQRFAEGPWLTREAMKWFWNAYAPEESQRNDILASPLRATLEQLSGLPPAMVITGENDVLRDEGEAYARKLSEAGVSTTSIRYNGTIHDFVMLDAVAESTPTRAAIAQACSTLRNILFQ